MGKSNYRRQKCFRLKNAEKAGSVNKISSEAVAKLTESDIIKTKKPLEINIQLFAKIPKEKFTMYALDPV